MPYESTYPPIDVPNLTLWTFLFNSPYSSLGSPNIPSSQLGSFIDSSTGISLPFSQVPALTTHFCTAITRRYGFKRGDVLACFAVSATWYPVALWGTIRAGGAFCGCNPVFEVSEMVYALTRSKARFVVADSGTWERVIEACKQVGIGKERVFLLEGEDGGKGAVEEEEGVVGVRELCKIGKGLGEEGQVHEVKLEEGESNKDLLCLLAFSSGTTGLPKVVMISHYGIIAQLLQLRDIRTPTPGTPTKSLAVIPFFHMSAGISSLALPVLINCTIIILPPPFSMANFLRTVTLYKIPDLCLSPPLVILLFNDPLVKEYDLSHVASVSSTAAPLSVEAIAAFENKFPNAKLIQGYGMTETSGYFTATPGDLVGSLPRGSVGRLLGSTQLKILSEDGKEVLTGVEGELRAKGPGCITLGYLEDKKSTKELFDEEGWLKTGDVGKMDENGWLFITDRIKEMIKTGRGQVAPAELEDCLLGHPLIADSAVIAIQYDPYSGEVPLAFVVLKPGTKNTNPAELEADIQGYVRERKSESKWIEGGVRFVEEIPRSPIGKILRRVLRDRVKAEGRQGGGGQDGGEL